MEATNDLIENGQKSAMEKEKLEIILKKKAHNTAFTRTILN